MSREELVRGEYPESSGDVEVSKDFKTGVYLAVNYLNRMLECYSVFNGAELARYFDGFINATMKNVNWDGAFLNGVLKVSSAVQKYADSDKTPREIVDEINSIFENNEKMTSFDESLSRQEVATRNKFARMLALEYHPDSPKVKSLSTEEVQRKTDIFKNRISPAIDLNGRSGLEALQSLVVEFRLAAE